VTINELRRAMGTQPFKPFSINMTDGRVFHVPHPEMVAILKGLERTVVLAVPGEEAVEIIDLLHVTSLSIGGNGKPRRKAG
jgi:hypothetical protein